MSRSQRNKVKDFAFKRKPNCGKILNRKQVAKAILILATASLGITCSLMVYFQLSKFINTQTTMATRIDDSNDSLDFPSAAVCPGLKYDRIRELVWPVRLFNRDLLDSNQNFEFPTTREEMDALWDDYTFKADEVIRTIDAEYQNANYTDSGYVSLTPQDLLNKEVGCLTLKEYWTPLGKCFSIDTLCKVKSGPSLHISFNLSAVMNQGVSPTVRQQAAFLGNSGYESGLPVHVGKVESNSQVEVVLYAKEIVNSGSENQVTETEYHKCITQAVYAKAKEISGRLCYHPSFTIILGPELSQELEPCAAEENYFQANFVLMEAMMLPHGNHGCKDPSSFMTYEQTRKEWLSGVFLRDGIASLYLHFGNTNVTLEEDYNLQDFYAIVATLGGSIGIFFGWSIYDLIKHIAKMVETSQGKKLNLVSKNKRPKKEVLELDSTGPL